MVSIIIPVYNSEKYLRKCFESIKNQTFKDLEIIVVNDGSTDNSLNICKEFGKEDKRVKIISKKNEGLSSARNAGLEITNGDIITFLDSDDYLDKHYIQKSFDLMVSKNADIVIMQMCNVAESTNDAVIINKKVETYVFDSERAIEESLYQKLYTCCAPGKMYKRDIIGNIRFPYGKLAEDLAVCHKFLFNSKKVIYTSEIGYYYRQHDNSIIHTFNSRRLDAFKWTREIESFCEKNYPKILLAAKCRTFNVAIHLLLEIPEKGKVREDCINEIKIEINRTRKSVLFNSKSRMRDRIAAFLSYFGEKVLKFFWNSKLVIKKKEY